MTKRGRPTIYTEDLADEICARLAEGESLVRICKDPAMPSRAVVYLWLGEKPAFLDKYTRARVLQAQSMFDEITEIARDTVDGVHDHNAAREGLRGLMWVTERLAPKKYGPRATVDHQSSDGSMSPRPVIQLSDEELARIASGDADGE